MLLLWAAGQSLKPYHCLSNGNTGDAGAGYFRLDLVLSTSATDILARCLTSVRVNVDSTCKARTAQQYRPACAAPPCQHAGGPMLHLAGTPAHVQPSLMVACLPTRPSAYCCSRPPPTCSASDGRPPLPTWLIALRPPPPAPLQISLAALNVAGNFVPSIWTGNPSKTYENYTECPLVEGPKITPASNGFLSVQAAIAKAFQGHVYGFDSTGAMNPKNPTTLAAVNPLVITAGQVIINQANGVTLYYAVTEVSEGLECMRD